MGISNLIRCTPKAFWRGVEILFTYTSTDVRRGLSESYVFASSVVDPGSGAFLTPGFGIVFCPDPKPIPKQNERNSEEYRLDSEHESLQGENRPDRRAEAE